MRLSSILITLIVVAVSFAGCRHAIEPGNVEQTLRAEPGFTVLTAHKGAAPDLYESMGTIRPVVSAEVSVRIMGKVEQVLVEEGDQVLAGATLAILDKTQVEAGLERARAGLSMARSQASLASTTFRRFKALREQDAVSVHEFDQVNAQRRQAGAAVSEAEAQLQAAQDMAREAVVKAPYDGRVAAKMIEEGDMASPGRPLFVIESGSGFRAELYAPESIISNVAPGGSVDVVVPSVPGLRLTGKVASVAPMADQRSHSFLVKVDLPDDARLKSGLFCRVMIPVGESELTLIPAGSVIARGQLTGIYMVDEQGVARFRLIRVGRELGDKVEVVSGLKDGDRFVANPSPQLSDGVKVESGK